MDVHNNLIHTVQLARANINTSPSLNIMFKLGLVSSAHKAVPYYVESKNDPGFYMVHLETSSSAQGYFSFRKVWRSASFNQMIGRPAKVICISAIKDDVTEREFIFLDV